MLALHIVNSHHAPNRQRPTHRVSEDYASCIKNNTDWYLLHRLYENPCDLFFTWIPEPSTSNGLKFEKLTTWRSSTLYKPISVPLPRGVKPGQTWKLAVRTILGSGRANENIPLIDLGTNDFGNTPFPVLSLPISFSSHPHPNRGPSGKGSSAKVEKQEEIERQFFVSKDDLGEPISLTIKEQTSFDLDKVFSRFAF